MQPSTRLANKIFVALFLLVLTVGGTFAALNGLMELITYKNTLVNIIGACSMVLLAWLDAAVVFVLYLWLRKGAKS